MNTWAYYIEDVDDKVYKLFVTWSLWADSLLMNIYVGFKVVDVHDEVLKSFCCGTKY